MNLRTLSVPLSVGALCAVLLGYVFFFMASIRPGLDARDAFNGQLDNARQTLDAAEKLPAANPEDLKTQVAIAQATLSAATSLFLSEPQAAQLVPALYVYADAAHVSITDLQYLPVPTPSPKDISRVTSVRIQVQGTSQALIDFMSRIKESSSRGFVVNSFSLTGGDTNSAALILTVSFYTYSPGVIDRSTTVAPAGNVVPLPASTATGGRITTPTVAPRPGGTATPKLIIHIVRTGDTLSTIARQYGTTVEAIIIANHLTNFNVTVGQQLAVPQP
jgi:LysM repeat protein